MLTDDQHLDYVLMYVNLGMDEAFSNVALETPENQARLLAHIEDRVEEQIDRLKGGE